MVLAAHSDQALAMLADPSDARGARCSARWPTSPTRRCCTPTARCCRAAAAAWASWNYHLLDEPAPRTTVTYWMNSLQALDSQTQTSA